MQSHTLTYPCPRQRSWLEGSNARYAPWDLHSVVEARLTGCWFIKGAHQFADMDAQKAAFLPLQELIEQLRQEA